MSHVTQFDIRPGPARSTAGLKVPRDQESDESSRSGEADESNSGEGRGLGVLSLSPQCNEADDHCDVIENDDASAEDDMYLFEPRSPEEGAEIGLDPPLGAVAQTVAQESLNRFLASHLPSSAAKKRARDLAAEPTARKRIKVAVYQSYIVIEQHTMTMEEGSTSLGDTVVVNSARPMHTHFACPFYIHDPVRYTHSCLARADLRSLQDVKHHLWLAHSRKLYCPTCYDAFDTTSKQHEHIRRAACVPGSVSRPQGVTMEQLQLLARRMEPWINGEIQWLNIWAIVFPHEKPPPKSYHLGEMESIVVMLRHSWSIAGRRTLESFFDKNETEKVLLDTLDTSLEDSELDALAVLSQAVLNHMIDELLRVFKPQAVEAEMTKKTGTQFSLIAFLRSLLQSPRTN